MLWKKERLEAVLADRNSAQKHGRARIILATAEGCGTMEIMRRAGVSKPVLSWLTEQGIEPHVPVLERKHSGIPALSRQNGGEGAPEKSSGRVLEFDPGHA